MQCNLYLRRRPAARGRSTLLGPQPPTPISIVPATHDIYSALHAARRDNTTTTIIIRRSPAFACTGGGFSSSATNRARHQPPLHAAPPIADSSRTRVRSGRARRIAPRKGRRRRSPAIQKSVIDAKSAPPPARLGQSSTSRPARANRMEPSATSIAFPKRSNSFGTTCGRAAPPRSRPIYRAICRRSPSPDCSDRPCWSCRRLFWLFARWDGARANTAIPLRVSGGLLARAIESAVGV